LQKFTLLHVKDISIVFAFHYPRTQRAAPFDWASTELLTQLRVQVSGTQVALRENRVQEQAGVHIMSWIQAACVSSQKRTFAQTVRGSRQGGCYGEINSIPRSGNFSTAETALDACGFTRQNHRIPCCRQEVCLIRSGSFLTA
jgi:hypothetical protein